MKTTESLSSSCLKQVEAAACIIRDGGVVAVPTETYYGLAVDPFNTNALQKLFRLKRRPVSKPILVLIASSDQLDKLTAGIPNCYHALMEEYWPGPLTLVFPARPEVSPILTAGTGTIGVRLTPHPVTRKIIELTGAPITATSANISGYPAAASIEDVKRMFGKNLDYLVDGGAAVSTLPSTVIRVSGEGFCIEREGAIDLSSRAFRCCD